MPAELCPVTTLTWPEPKTESAIDWRLPSPAGAAPIADGAGEFGAKGTAEAPMLALRPSNATIDFSFIYNSCGGSRREKVQRLAWTVGFRCRTPHPVATGSNRPFIGER